ncbi:toxin co-regulated pilus biosynthesis Q family protein [Burkholderia sp. PAMC 26561]|uniref:toxin co-regulated pilus biosynthesis Q family protein n=1 Tax=Burkholderia sp. PAMC 26561 TaxID=1795043 RepID=UPI00076B7CDD|nr:toxin co-regulated pilus biosynthesis Q family protein [Burkholderia sp. PAMC 26561]AME28715.1 pilus assembly protein [Burkholderia sp. PAMC 26561]
MKTSFLFRPVGRLIAFLMLAVAANAMAADPDQSRLAAPAGEGWQVLSAPSGSKATASPIKMTPASAASNDAFASRGMSSVDAKPIQIAMAPTSTAVAPVVLPSPSAAVAPNGILTFSITPQDSNLRNALDRWLQQQGWQLAWKIDDDLPLEFNATFSGDFKSILTQVMQATNHMRTPTRVCKHTNNVIRVVARAANCQE